MLKGITLMFDRPDVAVVQSFSLIDDVGNDRYIWLGDGGRNWLAIN